MSSAQPQNILCFSSRQSPAQDQGQDDTITRPRKMMIYDKNGNKNDNYNDIK